MNNWKVIYLASDHAGFEYKEKIKLYLENKGHKIIDLGTYSPERANYAAYGKKIANAVAQDDSSIGIAICGSGIGISIAANRHKNVRSARVVTIKWAKLARIHNNANILAIGARAISFKKAQKIVDAFLITPFAGGRHIKRIKTLDE